MPSLALSAPLSTSPSIGASDSPKLDSMAPQEADTQRRQLLQCWRQQSKTEFAPSSFTSSIGLIDARKGAESEEEDEKEEDDEDEKNQEGWVQPGQACSHSRHCRCIGDSSSHNVERALLLIQAAWQRKLSSNQNGCHVLHISPSEYLELRERLNDPKPLLNYFDNVLRFDYSPTHATLVLRLMATTVHEYMKEYFVDEVKEQLRALSRKHGQQHSAVCACRVPQIIPEIKWHGHARLDLDADVGSDDDTGANTNAVDTKSPDAQTWYGAASFPQFILEIGYSQKKVSLQDLARDYYAGSRGHIKTVLTLDIGYAKPSKRRQSSASAEHTPIDHTSVLCLYRGPDRIHKDMVFRDAQGRPTSNRLQLLASDFIPDDEIERLSSQTQHCISDCIIDISAEALCKLLAEAEAAQSRKDARKRKREEEAPSQDVVQAPRKRPSVNWARDAIVSDDSPRSSPDDGRLDPPQERRTTPDRLYQSSSHISGSSDKSDRQTRSMSRGERSEP